MEMQIAYVESLARIAAELDARVMCVSLRHTRPRAAIRRLLWRRVVVAIREMCDRSAAYGVTIAVQNHHDLALDTESLLELLAEIDRPNCKLGFDAWSPRSAAKTVRGCPPGRAAHRHHDQCRLRSRAAVSLSTRPGELRTPRARRRASRAIRLGFHRLQGVLPRPVRGRLRRPGDLRNLLPDPRRRIAGESRRLRYRLSRVAAHCHTFIERRREALRWECEERTERGRQAVADRRRKTLRRWC